MQNFELPLQPLNHEKADEDLRSLLGEAYLGMSTAHVIIIHLSDEADDTVKAQIQEYLKDHDPQGKSAAEQNREDRRAAWERWKNADLDAMEAKLNGVNMTGAVRDILGLLRDLQTGLKSNE